MINKINPIDSAISQGDGIEIEIRRSISKGAQNGICDTIRDINEFGSVTIGCSISRLKNSGIIINIFSCCSSCSEFVIAPSAAATLDAGVEQLGAGPTAEGRAGAVLFATTAETFRQTPHLAEEVFGNAGLLIRDADAEVLVDLLRGIEGQLTITIHMTEADEPLLAKLLPVLETKAGRILVNGWPTGVEVCHAMVHGGPFPATSDSRTTSVGTLSDPAVPAAGLLPEPAGGFAAGRRAGRQSARVVAAD